MVEISKKVFCLYLTFKQNDQPASQNALKSRMGEGLVEPRRLPKMLFVIVIWLALHLPMTRV